MGVELHQLVEEIRKAREGIEAGDIKTNHRIDSLEASVNNLFKRINRPGSDGSDNETFERKSATEMCIVKHAIAVPKNDGVTDDYTPSPADIDLALSARKAVKSLFRHGDASRLEPLEKKALTAFSLGSSGIILPPELSNIVVSCIVDVTDLTGLMMNVQTSAGGVLTVTCKAHGIERKPNPKKEYTPGKGCDVLVYYGNNDWVWKKVTTPLGHSHSSPTRLRLWQADFAHFERITPQRQYWQSWRSYFRLLVEPPAYGIITGPLFLSKLLGTSGSFITRCHVAISQQQRARFYSRVKESALALSVRHMCSQRNVVRAAMPYAAS